MIAQQLLPEFDQEFATTRRHLERVPDEKFEWAPHEKSMKLGRLAGHLAEIPMWVKASLEENELDMNPVDGEPWVSPGFDNRESVLKTFDENVATARAVVEATEDATFMENWSLKSAGETLFTMPKVAVIRAFVLNHVIHHRGQLSVYLRLCDCAVPQTYGPTADETEM